MRMRLVMLAPAMLLLSGYTEAQIEKAEQAASSDAAEFRKCLAAEVKRLVITNTSSQDFALLIKGSCLVEKDKLLKSGADYFYMSNDAPVLHQSAFSAIVNGAISDCYAAAVKDFIETRNNR